MNIKPLNPDMAHDLVTLVEFCFTSDRTPPGKPRSKGQDAFKALTAIKTGEHVIVDVGLLKHLRKMFDRDLTCVGGAVWAGQISETDLSTLQDMLREYGE